VTPEEIVREAFADDELMHYGTLHKSGRYPWGSGENPNQRHQDFLSTVDDLRKKGLSEKQIADGLGITTTQLRARKAIAKNEKRKSEESQVFRMKEKGMSNVAIGRQLGINESQVRALLDPAAQERRAVLMSTADNLRKEVADKQYLDIGAGVERYMGISKEKLNHAVAVLEEDGYKVHYVKVEQLGTGKQTTVKVLTAPDVPYKDVIANQGNIQQAGFYSDDGGVTITRTHPPVSINSKRVAVRYAEEGGADADGVIYVRPGVDDVSLGGSRYAQVRIAVDGTHYLKGMAMYKDDLPEGVDLQFNTNKSDTGKKLDALKPMGDDPDLPFGAVIKPGGQRGVMNIVNEEADWLKWSKTLSSQMLSKQAPSLAKSQLELTFAQKKADFDEINTLTNPAVKKKLLTAFSDSVDASAVHLKAAHLPRQSTHVILPINTLKDTEIYAPNYNNGDRVVLIRYPHGGTFEIPELTVNNRHPDAKAALGQAIDAVGINSKVAERLSGADFDGDTVLVIPNNSKKVLTSNPLEQLKDFDPKAQYKGFEGMPVMSERTLQLKMGDVSNLITDMTIRGATRAELARAVKHSMVVIDARKHKLNYKQSAKDNGISALKEKYQGSARGGASTLLSRKKSTESVPVRRARRASEGGPIDPVTGRKMFVDKGDSYTDAKGRTIIRTERVNKLENTDDAFKLVSDVGTDIEAVYANHSNRLKALANEARKATLQIPRLQRSPSASKTYAQEVSTLKAKLNIALKNAPLERQAQILANAVVRAKQQANPDMENAELKKIRGQALNEARIRTGARKERVDITQGEWNAIQAGAISNDMLNRILDNADLDTVKALATPRSATVATPVVMARAQALLAAGYTQAEIANQLGIPTSTLNAALSRKG